MKRNSSQCNETVKRRPGKPVTHPPIMDVESGLIFDTYKAAAEFVNGTANNVYHVAIGIQKHHKGHHFVFIKEKSE